MTFRQGYSQEKSHPPTQAVYVELGGAGLVYSFNYDFRFDKSNMNSWGMRVGAGGYSVTDQSLLTIPVQINRLYGNGRHFFELGGGATFVYYRDRWEDYQGYYNGRSYYHTTVDENYYWILETGDTPALMGTLNFGYRKVPEDGGFLFGVNLVPAFNQNGFWPLWAGVRFGYAF
ncbi:hypothetical protein DN752_18380 [Echinicola strongylocentroti]|uniref:DUF3575 domain-containing protein n=2 Tax=Echinicola strongylocentroti TaxID=1795355 RepID=A0A2Z4IR79_9BACT|nr:hypothetical protein DN752_18380 [Echinicola strongylocentroti]